MGRADLIRVVAESDDWLVVDKPSGLPVVPAPTSDASLWRTLEHQRDERLWVVHRIDRGTSGLVLFARNPVAHRSLSMGFEHGEVGKTYLAFVNGVPQDGRIDAPLHSARRGRMRPAKDREPGSLAARTDVRLLKTWDGAALLEARPHTGRHHQIRVHLKSAGAPLLIDPIYGGAPEGCASHLPNWRLTLHASKLAFRDTVIESPLPDDLVRVRDCLDADS